MTMLNLKALLYKILSTPLVIDDGTEDIWNYRKWSDGTAECWALNSGVYNIMTSYGNAYFATYYAQTSFLFPSGLFVAEPRVTITRQGREGTGLVYCSPYNVTKDRVDMFIANPGFQYPNASIGYGIHAIGRWK